VACLSWNRQSSAVQQSAVSALDNRASRPCKQGKMSLLPRATKKLCLCHGPLQFYAHLLLNIMAHTISFPSQIGHKTHESGQKYPAEKSRSGTLESPCFFPGRRGWPWGGAAGGAGPPPAVEAAGDAHGEGLLEEKGRRWPSKPPSRRRCEAGGSPGILNGSCVRERLREGIRPRLVTLSL